MAGALLSLFYALIVMLGGMSAYLCWSIAFKASNEK